MKIFLAGSSTFPEELTTLKTSPYLLESYLSFKDWQKPLLKTTKMFMIDSGAFTFRKKTKNADWNNFIREYGKFINANGIDYFFELDIDNIIGYENVRKLTKELKTITGKNPIPVWHANRGAKEFERLCEEYDYISIGGIAGAGHKVKEKYQAMFPWFIQTAHKYGTEIHGLGFTSSKLKHNHFDSVDSTSWTGGGRWGHITRFSGKGMERIPTNNRRIKDLKAVTHFNLTEWIKFQKYAELYL